MNQPWVYMCSPSWPSLPPPSPSHPSGSSQCTSPEHPVSCIEPGLAIYFTYDNIHVSMLFSQIIPSSPSPTSFRTFKWMIRLSLAAQIIKNLPAMQETQVRSLGQNNPLEEDMAATPVFLLGNYMDRGSWRATVPGVTKRHDWATNIFPFLSLHDGNMAILMNCLLN